MLRDRRASGLAERLADELLVPHAPHFLVLEVAQALRRLEAAGVIRAERAAEALNDAAALAVERHPHEALLRRIWELRHNLTAYDAAYVALAERLGTALVTTDARLASAPDLRAPVELI